MIEMERAVNQILWYECMGDVDEYFENDTYIAKPYDWNLDDNNDWHFYHKPSGLKIQWYKYPLRGAMWNMDLTHEQFLDVLYDCRSSRYKNITWDHDKWWERRNDMNRTHKIKLEKEYCDSVYYGDKTFEVRYNDRGYQKGDYIRFVPVDGIYNIIHPISDKEYEITYVHSGFGLKEMFVVLGIKEFRHKGEEQ